MDRRIRHTTETRFEAARLFEAGFGYSTTANILGIPLGTARDWLHSHTQGRLLGLGAMATGNRTYSTDAKVAAVEKFLDGALKTDVLQEFDITGRALLNKWIAIYRAEGAQGLAHKPKGRPVKTHSPENETLEEKVYRLEMENAILKKYHALMEQEQALTARGKQSHR